MQFSPLVSAKFPGPIPHRSVGRHSVLIGILPDDYAPAEVWEIPPRLDDVQVIEERITMGQGIAVTRQFNREQLLAGIPDRRWAIFSISTKPSQEGVRA